MTATPRVCQLLMKHDVLFPHSNSLEMALARPITVLDNERFTVQSVITKHVCPVVLVSRQQQGSICIGTSCCPDVRELTGCLLL